MPAVCLAHPPNDTDTASTLVVPSLLPSKIFSRREAGYGKTMQKYVIPALRQRRVSHSTNQRGILGSLPSCTIQGMQKPAFRDPSITGIVIEEMPANLIPSDEVEPCFRTPSNYYKFSQKSKLTWRSPSFIMMYFLSCWVFYCIFIESRVCRDVSRA